MVGFAQPRTVPPLYDGINFELVWDGALGRSLTDHHVSSPLAPGSSGNPTEGGPMIGKNLDPAALRADRAAGMTFVQLAQKHDCSPSTIRWHLLDQEERQNWRAQKNRNGHHKRSAPVLATTGPARDTEANPGKPEKKKSEKRQGNGHRAQ